MERQWVLVGISSINFSFDNSFLYTPKKTKMKTFSSMKVGGEMDGKIEIKARLPFHEPYLLLILYTSAD